MYLFETRKVCSVIYYQSFFWRLRTDMVNRLDFFEAATWGILSKKVVLKISQNPQENTCVGVSILINLHDSGLQLYEKRDSDTGAFQWIQRIFKNIFFSEHLRTTASKFYNWKQSFWKRKF